MRVVLFYLENEWLVLSKHSLSSPHADNLFWVIFNGKKAAAAEARLELSSHLVNRTGVLQLRYKMKGPNQLWLLKTGLQSYLRKEWSICSSLAWNSYCRLKLEKHFSPFPELWCAFCSLVKTVPACCKGNCILMVDGDEPRMRKCRRTVLTEGDYSVIVLK